SGCLKQTKGIKRLDSLYSSKLNIIALNFGDKEERINSYINEHDIPWLNGHSSPEINSKLLVDSYPFLVFIDKNKRVLILHAKLDEIEQILIE
ncbi:thioredoxin-like domain-containing protein, partial [Clostridium perfringens]|nr:thioredoxin-like domain-containing protein [Clostridium perfringens]